MAAPEKTPLCGLYDGIAHGMPFLRRAFSFPEKLQQRVAAQKGHPMGDEVIKTAKGRFSGVAMAL
jgi:hypothetical protein